MRFIVILFILLFTGLAFAEEAAPALRITVFNKMIHDGNNEQHVTHQQFMSVINEISPKMELEEFDEEITTKPMLQVAQQRQPAALSFSYFPAEFHIILIPKKKLRTN